MKCTLCESERIIKGLRPVDHGHLNSTGQLALEIVEKPDAIIFKGYKEIPLFAHICKDCGNVMFQLSQEELDIVTNMTKKIIKKKRYLALDLIKNLLCRIFLRSAGSLSNKNEM